MNHFLAKSKINEGKKHVGGGQFAEFHCMWCNSWPYAKLWPPTPAEICHERELLNTKWRLVEESKSEGERHTQSSGEGERESCTQRTHLSAPSRSLYFLPLLWILSCFCHTETVVLSFYKSLLLSSGFFGTKASPSAATVVNIGMDLTATRTSRTVGGKMWDEALMRVRPHHPGRNVCKSYAHTKRTLGRWGRRRPSSRWARRKMSGSGQKNDNKTPPPPFTSSLSFIFVLHQKEMETDEHIGWQMCYWSF